MKRCAIVVRGTVQGVGFRPFVYGLASRLQLGGYVRNDSGGVRIEVEGEQGRLDEFLAELKLRPPPLARIEEVGWEPREPVGERGFRIEQSLGSSAGAVSVSPDIATCEDCLRELFDPKDRRYRYPFLNCTNCGPRLTIVRGVPYDRERTTMAGFPMCPACRAEYEDPLNRRFHAQPTACPVCGPRLQAADREGREVAVGDPLKWFAATVMEGRIGAMKGLGGYHLVCDAGNGEAVTDLRRRKHRDEKPFAVMIPDVAAADAICQTTEEERRLLSSVRRPIVLLRKRAGGGVGQGVAPGNPTLGVMLPYTPLHCLLMDEVGGRPLVMTSGNRSDEPIAIGEPEVFERLAGIADSFLTHDRPIHVRCDDSVTRVSGGAESPVRRSRGYAPDPTPLPVRCAVPILAVGGQLKGTFALGEEARAVVSHHMGDLDHFAAYRAFERDVGLFERLLGIRPACIAHDLHPDYASTRYALDRARREGIPAVGVQHHHAHVASCMAEHGLTEPVIGVSFDGTGFGTDGAIWGGEFLIADLRGFRRAGHFRYVPMPGGERAIREPWRMAVAYLDDAGVDCAGLWARLSAGDVRTVRRMVERGINAPMTSSAGRLFDAVAAIVGVRDRVTFEGQAAMELEWLAESESAEEVYPFGVSKAEGAYSIDVRPLVREVVREVEAGVRPGAIARRFHRSVAEVILTVCERLRGETGINNVVLSGGVFMNSLLMEEATGRLKVSRFCPFRHRLVPTNDGGISLGQLAIAACQSATKQ